MNAEFNPSKLDSKIPEMGNVNFDIKSLQRHEQIRTEIARVITKNMFLIETAEAE